ncbi:MAG TPA: DEAD/DEAH box helicase [Phycisphaerae bacterium]|nr:DEAD/DEAH box helicase [Phycisphaerae bacterium]
MHFQFLQPSLTPDQILALLSPPVRAWWTARFKSLSAPQALAIPALHAGQNVLVCAPTGTGKTLCAFIAILDDLLRRHAANALPDAIDTLYISPLRALGTDIQKNLTTPLSEIAAHTPSPGQAIRIAQRTGDTPAKERAALLRRPPHILITTPESLALCLAAPGTRDLLRSVRRIIIDELHALAPNKRGTDLALSLERLSHLTTTHSGADPQRIGLSATIAPLDRLAHFLVGNAPDETPRPCAIADASFPRPLDLSIASPFAKSNTPFLTTAQINKHVYDLLESTIRRHRTTLIFTNLRAATERVTFQLRKRFAANPIAPDGSNPTDIIAPAHIEAHHSSLDRDLRLDIERRLKLGQLRAVVCSTSLELGIDIGAIDRVILLNSPKGVARGLQRVGRSGHSLDATAKGTFLPTIPADLVESLVTAHAMRHRRIDQIHIPENPLDVLAQHLIGLALQHKPHGIHTDHAFAIIRRTYPYRTLTRDQFTRVLDYIATPQLRDTAHLPAKLFLEPSGLLHPLRPATAGLYAQNAGTITQETQVHVRLHNGGPIGKIEEAFAQILKPGDRFVLAGRCVQFHSAKAMSVFVTECAGQTPTIPRWYSGTLAMEPGLAAQMRDFRAKVRAIAPAGESAIARTLTRQFAADTATAKSAAQFLHAQFRYADIPTNDELLVERVPDDDAVVLVFHTMIGRAANEALARAVAYRIHQRFGRTASTEDPVSGHNATVVIDDYAFAVWISNSSAARRADRTLIRSLLAPAHFDEDLAAAIDASELFRAQFRYTAIRAHALLQNKFGRRRYIGQLQSYATRLHDALREHHPDHLLLEETRRTITHDLLNAPAAKEFLAALTATSLRLLDLPSPSPFAFGLFAAGGGKRDTLQLADTADFLLAMYQQVQRRLASQILPAAAPASLFS